MDLYLADNELYKCQMAAAIDSNGSLKREQQEQDILQGSEPGAG